MEDGSTEKRVDEVEFASDLAELRPQALRRKYAGEANSHAGIKRRCATGDFELDPSWNDFRSFLRDVGPRPISSATIDRIDPHDRRYGPGLCRWATKADQTKNRRNTRYVDVGGERQTLGEFAASLNLPYSTVHAALGRGESAEDILRRATAAEANHQSFQPAWLSDADKLKRWRADYEGWYRRVRRDRRASAPPEVYAVILASEALHASRRKLKAIGAEEMTFDEHERAKAQWANDFRIVNEAGAWMRHALGSLARHNGKLAAQLMPTHGHWEEVCHFEQWLIPRSETPNR